MQEAPHDLLTEAGLRELLGWILGDPSLHILAPKHTDRTAKPGAEFPTSIIVWCSGDARRCCNGLSIGRNQIRGVLTLTFDVVHPGRHLGRRFRFRSRQSMDAGNTLKRRAMSCDVVPSSTRFRTMSFGISSAAARGFA